MKFVRFLLLSLLPLLFASAGALRAHEPYLLLTANADGTFTAETGFSDGASAEGLPLVVRDRTTGAVLSEHFLPEDGKLTLKIPAVAYRVVFEGGPGHRISKPGPESEKPAVATPTPVTETVAAPLPPVPAASSGPVKSEPAKSVTAVSTLNSTPAATPAVAVVAAAAPVVPQSASPAANDTLRMVLIVGIFFLFGVLAFALGYGAGRRAR